ncbi:MAG: hypothetical protein PHY30_02810 [Candidatus Pacebacteria bacterium]|nr:hypothetical protein [Candidatus Paceibacterota bacterium]
MGKAFLNIRAPFAVMYQGKKEAKKMAKEIEAGLRRGTKIRIH